MYNTLAAQEISFHTSVLARITGILFFPKYRLQHQHDPFFGFGTVFTEAAANDSKNVSLQLQSAT